VTLKLEKKQSGKNMQLGLGLCLVGYSTRVKVAVGQQGLGFDSAEKYN
jgi:hypothetical protein